MVSLSTGGHRSLMYLSVVFIGRRVLSTSVVAKTLEPATNRRSNDQVISKGDTQTENQLNYVTAFHNRNPRNLELMALTPKARGYGTTPARQDYYHK